MTERWQEWDTCPCTEDEDEPPGCGSCGLTGFVLVTLGPCEWCGKPTPPIGSSCICDDCWPVAQLDVA